MTPLDLDRELLERAREKHETPELFQCEQCGGWMVVVGGTLTVATCKGHCDEVGGAQTTSAYVDCV